MANAGLHDDDALREALARCCKCAKNSRMLLASGKRRTSTSARGTCRCRSWYNSGVHSVLSKSKTRSLGRCVNDRMDSNEQGEEEVTDAGEGGRCDGSTGVDTPMRRAGISDVTRETCCDAAVTPNLTTGLSTFLELHACTWSTPVSRPIKQRNDRFLMDGRRPGASAMVNDVW